MLFNSLVWSLQILMGLDKRPGFLPVSRQN